MIRSLTAFGRVDIEQEGLRYSIELRSVNNRYLDVSTRLPRNMMMLESEVRAMVKNRIERGKINVFVEEPREDVLQSKLEIDPQAAKALIDSLRKVASENDLKDDVTTTDLAHNLNLISGSESAELAEKRQQLVLKGLKQAIDRFQEMSEAEGRNLQEDFLKRLKLLDDLSSRIEATAEDNREQTLVKLRERIEKYVVSEQVDEGRLEQEVAYIIDRLDITEELVRLRSHNDLFRQALDEGGAVGKRLNFILQEMNREINTIGSKASNANIATWVVEAKEELEKIREQVQNVV